MQNGKSCVLFGRKRKQLAARFWKFSSKRQNWTASTVKTLLKRLVDKGYLATQKSGKSFFIQHLFLKKEAINRQADELFDKFCQRKHTVIIKHLLETTPMTMADINDLQALLLSTKEEALEEVPCNCIPGQCRCKEHLSA